MNDNASNYKTGIVYSVYPLKEDLLSDLQNALSHKHGCDIRLVNKIDTSLIQGIKVEIDNFVVDGSTKAKLSSMKEQLLKQGGFGHAID